LCCYAIVGAGDMAHHLIDGRPAGGGPPRLGEYAVAFAAGLFWPLDIVAQLLLSFDRG